MEYSVVNKEDIVHYMSYFRVQSRVTHYMRILTEDAYAYCTDKSNTYEDCIIKFRTYLHNIIINSCFLFSKPISTPLMLEPFVFDNGISLCFSDVLKICVENFGKDDCLRQEFIKSYNEVKERLEKWYIENGFTN